MKINNLFCIVVLLFAFVSNVMAAPAGVSSGLNLWLKADDSTTVTIDASDEITQWDDSAGNGYSFTNTGNYPQFIQDTTDETFNFNPYLDFQGSRFLTISGVPNLADTDAQTIFVVIRKRTDNQGLFQFEDSTNAVTWIALQSFIIDGEGKADFNSTSVPSNIAILVGGQNDVDGDSQQYGFYNGNIYASGLGADDTNNITNGTATLGQSNGFNNYTGMLAEFIIYTQALDNTDIQKVNTYLALKYGITMQGTATAYIAADGTTLWDMTETFTYDGGGATADYNNNIAGIARDDANDLNQTKSKSVNSDSIITIEQTSLADGQAVLWGHDDFSLSNTTGEYVTDQIVNTYYNYTLGKRIRREWKVRNANSVAVDMAVDVSSFSLSTDMVLMIDSDGQGQNGDNTSAYDIVISADSNDGTTAVFSNVTFPDSAVFTFGDEQVLYDVLGLTDTTSSANEASFSWTYPDNVADSFTIYQSGSPVATANSTTRSYSQSAKCNTSYTFEIVATNASGSSDPSSITVKTDNCPPAPPNSPDNFQASNITSDSTLLTWTDTSTKELGFILQRFNQDTSSIEVSFDLVRDTESYQDTELSCETNYNYSIVARGSASNSSSTSLNLTTALCAPTNLQASKTDTEINLTWIDNTNSETGFILTRQVDSDETTLVTNELNRNTEAFTDTEFDCGTTYVYSLIAVASDNTQSTPITQKVTTVNCPDFATAPSNFQATTIEQTTISLSWSDDYDSETGFELSRDGVLISTLSANATRYTDSNVTCGTSYNYSILAFNSTTKSPATDLDVSSVDCDIVEPEPTESEQPTTNPILPEQPTIDPEPTEPEQPTTDSTPPTQPVITDPEPTLPEPPTTDIESPNITQGNNGLPRTPKLGIVPVPTTNANQTSGNLTILKAGVVTGGALESTNQSEGLVSNIILLPDSILIGGRMSGTNQSQGLLQDIHLTQYSELTGGILSGQINNNGLLQQVMIAEGAVLTSSLGVGRFNNWVRNFGTIQGIIRLQAGTSLFGGVIDGEIIGDASNPPFIGMAQIAEGSELKNVRLSPTTVLPNNVTLINVTFPNDTESPDLQDFNIDPEKLNQLTAEQMMFEPTVWTILDTHELALIPPEAFAGISTEAMQLMSTRIVNALSPEQFAYIPVNTFAGLTRHNIAAFSPAVIRLWTKAHFEALNFEEWLNTKLMGKIFTNLNPELIDMAFIQAYLPDSWQMDMQTGDLAVPAGSLVSFPAFNAALPDSIKMPFMLDTSQYFGFAGLGSGDALKVHLNRTLKLSSLNALDLSQFIFTQNRFGIFNIVGTGEYEGSVFAFMPGTNNIEQAPLNVAVGVDVLENGYIQMTTPDLQTFELIPAPNNPIDLQRVLGQDSEMVMSADGDVMMGFNRPPETQRQTRFETDVMMIGVFDAFVEPAPDQFCTPDCGFGMDFPNDFGFSNFRIRSEAQMIYANGTKQKIYPTVIYPRQLIEQLQQFDNIDKVIYNADGSFSVDVKQPVASYKLEADFNVEITQLALGEKRRTTINLQTIDGELFLIYQVQYEDLWLAFNLLVTPVSQ